MVDELGAVVAVDTGDRVGDLFDERVEHDLDVDVGIVTDRGGEHLVGAHVGEVHAPASRSGRGRSEPRCRPRRIRVRRGSSGAQIPGTDSGCQCFFGFHRVESVGHRRCKVLSATIIRNGSSLLQHQLCVGGALTAPCLLLIDHRRGGHRSAWRLFQLGEQLLLGTVPVPVRDLRHLIQDCCLDPSRVPQYTPACTSS